MPAPKKKAQPEARRPKDLTDGQRTNRSNGKPILTHSVGAIPIINRLLLRMRLAEFLDCHLPAQDKRTRVETSTVVLLLLRNLLVSREPMYGMAEWAMNFGPELFDLSCDDLHTVGEFDVSLNELHNDSNTVTFSGEYPTASGPQLARNVPAITWGHNKDHRPDLKQLLYIMTVSEDGGVPVYFQAASGNAVDDQTQQATWKLMKELVQRPDFVYVVDCKLATTENSLMGILKRKVIDSQRSQVRQPLALDAKDGLMASLFDESGHWNTIWKRGQSRSLGALEREGLKGICERCLRALPENQAKVFALKEIEAKSSEEVRQYLDISSSNLWVLMHRARLRLADCLRTKWEASSV